MANICNQKPSYHVEIREVAADVAGRMVSKVMRNDKEWIFDGDEAVLDHRLSCRQLYISAAMKFFYLNSLPKNSLFSNVFDLFRLCSIMWNSIEPSVTPSTAAITTAVVALFTF